MTKIQACVLIKLVLTEIQPDVLKGQLQVVLSMFLNFDKDSTCVLIKLVLIEIQPDVLKGQLQVVLSMLLNFDKDSGLCSYKIGSY